MLCTLSMLQIIGKSSMSNTFDFALLLNSYFPIKAMFRMMSPVIELSYYLKANYEFIGISPFRINI